MTEDRAGAEQAAAPGGRLSKPAAETPVPRRRGGSTSVTSGRPRSSAATTVGRDDTPSRSAGLPPRPALTTEREEPAGKPATRRTAKLALRKVDPMSVFVLSLLISVFVGVVLLVAVGLLYYLLDQAGVLKSVDTFARELSLIGQDATVLSAGRVMSVAAIVAAVDVVVLTVLATLSAVLYNVCASFTGGIEVTLSERD